MPTKFAQTTDVPVEKSQQEIRKLLVDWGCDQRIVGDDDTAILIRFRKHSRVVQIVRPLPEKPATKRMVKNQFGAFDVAEREWQQEIRRQWRVVLTMIRMRFEEMAEADLTVDESFMPYIQLPDQTTVKDHLRPVIQEAYRSGQMPASILPGLPPAPKVIELPQRSGS